MGDPVSIVGLVLAVPPLIKPIVDYISGVKDAPRNVVEIRDELRNLQSIFMQLADLLEDERYEDKFSDVSTLYHSTRDFSLKLEDFRQKLEKRSRDFDIGIRQMASSMLDPFRDIRTQRTLQMLQRYTQLFQFALTINGCRMLSQTPTAVSSQLQAQFHQLSTSQSRILEALQALPSHVNYDQMRNDLLNEISDLDFRTKQRKSYGKRHPKTANSLLQNAEFREWFTALKPATLWCWGNPGAGKTILMSTVIHHTASVTSGQNVAVVYVYCDHKDPATHSAAALLNNITRQLVEQTKRKETIDELTRYQNNTRSQNGHLTYEEVLSQLLSISSDFDKTYAFFDAVDELPETNRDELLNGLGQLESKVHVFLTSRPNIDPTPKFQNLRQINIMATVHDVRIYMESEIERNPRLAVLNADEHSTLKQKILDGVNHMASGMFLLAQLQIETLSRQRDIRRMEKAMEAFATNVAATYDESLKRIKEQDNEDDVELAMRTFSLICCATRPLAIEEVLSALAVEADDAEFDSEALPRLEFVLGATAGLIVVSQDENNHGQQIETMRLVHFTLQEYFEANREQLFPTMQLDISRTCLTFMNSIDIQAQYTRGGVPDFPKFFFYAICSWGHHLRYVEADLIEQALQFIRNDEQRKYCMLIAADKERNSFWQRVYDTDCSPLAVASVWGLELVLKKLLESYDINSNGGGSVSPLILAAAEGHIASAKLLLRAGADVNLKWSKESDSPLQAAMQSNSLSMVYLLIEHGANVNEKESCESPLHTALGARCDESIIKLLLRKGAKVDARAEQGITPLHVAAGYCEADVVRLILDAGANPEAVDVKGITPLQMVPVTHRDVVRLLVLRGVRIPDKIRTGQRDVNPMITIKGQDMTETDLDEMVDWLCQPFDSSQNLGRNYLKDRIGEVFREYPLLEEDS